MLGDEDVNIRKAAVQTMHSLRLQISRKTVSAVIIPSVCPFCIPKLDFKAKTNHQFVNHDVVEMSPITKISETKSLTDQQLDHTIDEPLRLNHPCHNQTVERYIKLVTEAILSVVGFERNG